MASNFSSIGFDVNSDEEFDQMIDALHPRLSECETAQGTYFKWSENDDFGPEVWIRVVNEEMVGVTPYFRGKSRMSVGLNRSVEELQDSPIDMFIFSSANPVGNDTESGDYSFIFEMISFYTYEDLELPAIAEIRLTGIAQELEVYQDEAEFEKESSDDGMDFSSENFIPIGLYETEDEDEDEDEEFCPSPIVMFSGKVLEARKMLNPVSSKEFYWALVKTYGGTIDVTIDLEYIEDTIEVGNIISGIFYLVGDFVD